MSTDIDLPVRIVVADAGRPSYEIWLSEADAWRVDDHARQTGHLWRLHFGTGYVRAGGIYLHRFLLGATIGDGTMVDHINGYRLDNRRSNLRLVTSAENTQNRSARTGSRSGIRGVSYNAGRKKPWSARVTAAGVDHHLGYFATAEEAGVVVSAARQQLMTHTVEERHVL